MNTKQLWNALCLNPVTNQYFDGIYSADTLKEIREKLDLIICNTDPSNKPGEHWVLFFFSDNSVDFFDSLGRDIKYYGSIFLDLLRILLLIMNKVFKEPNPLRVIYVDNIVYIMLLRNVMDFLWTKLFTTYLIIKMLSIL